MTFKNTLLLIISFLSFISFGQSVLYNEDFEQVDFNEWTVLKLDDNIVDSSMSEYTNQAWIIKKDNFDTTNTVVSSTSFFTTQNKANRWLISPEIQLGATGNVISWNAKSFDPSFPDNYAVLISLGGNSPSDFIDTISLQILESYNWTNHTFSLSALGFDNQTIRIAFVLNSFDGYELFIDDVEIRENDNLGIESETNSNKKSIYFYNDILYSNKLVSEFNLFDINGKLIFNTKNQFKKLNLDFVDKGNYFADIKIDNKTFKLKIFK